MKCICGFIPYYTGLKNLKILASINYTIRDEDIEYLCDTVIEMDHGEIIKRDY